MSWVVEHLHRDGSVLARLPVTDQPFLIGRALDNALVLDDPHCAAHHASIEISNDATAPTRLVDLGSANGILNARKRRAASHDITGPEVYRLGNSSIRIRSSEWPVAPELTLSRRAVWPFALLAVALVLSHGAWDIWIRHTTETVPNYFYDLSALAAGLCAWSAVYALLGRLVSGGERFFSHLLIASCGYLSGTILLNLLDVLAFSTSWLWPIQITQPVIVLVAASTVRFHLRLADPRHWPTLRLAVLLVAVTAILVPLAQKWVSYSRLTEVQTHGTLHHPSLRLAVPITVEKFSAGAEAQKARVDAVRKKEAADADSFENFYDYDR